MHQLRKGTSKFWQNMHEKMHVPSGVHEELTMTDTEPKTQTEHNIPDTKQPTIIMSYNNPASTKPDKEAPCTTTDLTEIPTTQSLLTGLPTELFEQIFSYLSLPSKVCLALSCKGLYQLYSSVLTSNELRFPQAPYFWGIPILTTSGRRKPFLTQLEDSRWACCGRCQKLHPRSEFPKDKLEKSDPFDRACMPCAGIVDLCPCIALTIRDRDHIIDYLKGTASDSSSKKKLYHVSRGLLKDSWNGKTKQHSLVHECNAQAEAVANIRLSVTESDQFLAYSQYSTYLGFHDRELTRVHVCRHLTLKDRLMPLKPSCENCDTHSTVVSGDSELKVVGVTRLLGKGSWSGNEQSVAGPWLTRFTHPYQWYKQCRITSYY